MSWLSKHLQFRLAIAMIVVMLVPTSLLLMYNIYQSQQTLLEQLQLSKQQVARAQSSDIEAQLLAPMNDTLFLTQAVQVQRYIAARADVAPLRLPAVMTLFESVLAEEDSVFHRICILGILGDEILCLHNEDGDIVRVNQGDLQNRVNEDYFSTVINQGRSNLRNNPVYLSPVSYHENDDDANVHYSTLLQTTDGVTKGVLVAEVEVQDILAPVLEGSTTDELFVVDENGRYLYHPDPTVTYVSSVEDGIDLSSDSPNDSQLILANDTSILLNTDDNPDTYQVAARIQPQNQEIRWTLLYRQPLSVALATVNETALITAGVAGALVVLALFLIFVMTRNIVHPIQLLSSSVNALAEGQLDTRVHIQRTDEIGQLATGFNTMADRLQENIEDLQRSMEQIRQAEEDKHAADEERARLQEQIIETQKQTLKELSTPIIPISDRVIIMPLIGSVDSQRAQDILRSLLEGITTYRAKVVIIDITGVPILDTGVADHLNKTIQAARLKGTRTILTGISDAVAETIVDLGINWSGVQTLRDLQSGLALVMEPNGKTHQTNDNHTKSVLRKV